MTSGSHPTRTFSPDPTDALGCSMLMGSVPQSRQDSFPSSGQGRSHGGALDPDQSPAGRGETSQSLLPHHWTAQVKIHSNEPLAARISARGISCCSCPSEHSGTHCSLELHASI